MDAPAARGRSCCGSSWVDTDRNRCDTGDDLQIDHVVAVSDAWQEGAPQGTASSANCTEVEAAGAAPIHPGDPGFEREFDQDDDGAGCES